MPPEPADIQLLTQVGFLAAGRGDVARALRIFEALALFRPAAAFAFVGQASALMNGGRAAEAAQRLQRVHLPPGPEADMLQAFLGLALQLAGRAAESQAVLRQTMRRAAVASAGARLAACLLGEAPSSASSADHLPALSL